MDATIRTVYFPVHVQAKQLPEPALEILGVAVGIALAAAVARAGVEVAVGAERQLPAVVVLVRLVDEEELADADRLLPGPRAVLDDARVAVYVRVVHVEEAVGRVARVEGERQEPLLAAALDEVADVEERGREDATVPDHANPSRLLDHVDPLRLSRSRRDVHRGGEGAGDPHEPQPAPGGRLRRSPLVARRRRAAARDREGEEQEHRAESHPSQRSHLPLVRAPVPNSSLTDRNIP